MPSTTPHSDSQAGADPQPATTGPTGSPTGSQQEGAGHSAGHSPATTPPEKEQTAILRRALYRCLIDNGQPARLAARTLNRSWGTVQGALHFLLENAIIRHKGGQPAPRGAVQFFEPGPAAQDWVAGWVAGHRTGGTGRPATLRAVIHRGRRSVKIEQAPLQPERAVGWLKRSTPSGQVVHTFAHLDGERRAWKFQVHNGRTLQVFPPSVKTSDPEVVKSAPTWWDDFVGKEARRWAQGAGYVLAGDRVLKASQPIEYALPQAGVPKFGSPASDVLFSDDTPEKGTAETTDAGLASGLMRAPADIAALKVAVQGLGQDVRAILGVMQEERRVSGEIAKGLADALHVQHNHSRALATILEAATSAPSPPPPPSPGFSGVEFQ